MRLALLALLLLLPVTGDAEMPMVGMPNAEPRCEGEWCMVPKPLFVELAKQAQLVEQYAEMCGWTKP